MQAMDSGFSSLGGGLLAGKRPSGLTSSRSVRTFTPGIVPRVLGGLMMLTWSGEFCAGAKPLSDTTMIANVAINNHVLLFIYFSFFAEVRARTVGIIPQPRAAATGSAVSDSRKKAPPWDGASGKAN